MSRLELKEKITAILERLLANARFLRKVNFALVLLFLALSVIFYLKEADFRVSLVIFLLLTANFFSSFAKNEEIRELSVFMTALVSVCVLIIGLMSLLIFSFLSLT